MGNYMFEDIIFKLLKLEIINILVLL